MEKRANLFLVVCYISVNFIILAGTLICKPDTSDERRNPAKFPDLAAVPYSTICRQMDDYFKDHFGFRNEFLRSFKFVRNRIFKVNSQLSVITGRDNWFFLRRCVKGYTGEENRINDSQCRMVADLISQMGEKLNKKNIPFYFVVVPDKAVVYSEYLPDWVKKSSRPTIKQKILAMLSENPNVRIIDLEQPMIEARKKWTQDLYYKLDSHWNAIGAYEGYLHIVERINKDGINVSPHLNCTFTESVITNGDLSGLIGLYKLQEDIKYNLLTANPIETQIIAYDPVKGNPQIIRSDNSDAELNLFMIRDSFSTDMIPHFAQCFGSCCFYWNKNIEDSMKLLESESPDIVVLETIERYLYQLYEENFTDGGSDSSDF